MIKSAATAGINRADGEWWSGQGVIRWLPRRMGSSFGGCVSMVIIIGPSFVGCSAIADPMSHEALMIHRKRAFMKSRLSLIFATLVVLLGSMVWVVQDRHSSSAVPAM